MKSPLISIIIPCYNAAYTINKCIRSITSQTYKNIELIIVNDASIDNSKDKILAFRDDRIRYIENDRNLGVDISRFNGLLNSNGLYVFFLDSDDWISGKNTLQIMVDAAISTDSDYVEIYAKRVLDRLGIIKRKISYGVSGVIDQPELFDKYFISFLGVNKLSVAIWGKLYKKSFLESLNIQPSGMKMGEDVLFNLKIFPHLHKICILPIYGYNYQFGGVTSHYNPNLMSDMFSLYENKLMTLDKYNYFEYKGKDTRALLYIELINILRSEIRQNIRYHKDKNIVIEKVKDILEDKRWDNLCSYSSKSSWFKQDFPKAVINKDVNKLYELCFNDEYRYRPILFAKKTISKILSIL